jgi:hypothetical protein
MADRDGLCRPIPCRRRRGICRSLTWRLSLCVASDLVRSVASNQPRHDWQKSSALGHPGASGCRSVITVLAGPLQSRSQRAPRTDHARSRKGKEWPQPKTAGATPAKMARHHRGDGGAPSGNPRYGCRLAFADRRCTRRLRLNVTRPPKRGVAVLENFSDAADTWVIGWRPRVARAVPPK